MARPPLPAWRAMLGSVRVLFGGAVVLAFALVALLAPIIAPVDPLEQDILGSYLPPAFMEGGDPKFLLGTDNLGRDVLSRLLHGTQIAALIAVVAAMLAGLVGTILGLLAGYFGGIVDTLISRLVDTWMAFPPVLLAIVLVAVLGTSVTSVIVAIVVVDWTRFCRVVRAEVQAQAREDYVTAARALGMGGLPILLREILPNVAPLLLVLFTLEMGIAVVVEAILSFVGLSVGSELATWGGMIGEGRVYIHQAWWVLAFPMAAIILVVLALNLLGDGLRVTLDPVQRR